MHALIENGAVAKYPYTIGDLKAANPNTSFAANVSDAELEAYGVYRVYFSTQPAITRFQALEESAPIFSEADQRWTQVWAVRDMAQEEADALTSGQAASVRAERNTKLTESDWTQVLDAPVDQTAWSAYRQELRDITKQDGFPWNIQWPEAP